jgi:hypothetical protein
VPVCHALSRAEVKSVACFRSAKSARLLVLPGSLITADLPP